MREKILSKLNLWAPPFLWAIVIFMFSTLTVTPSTQIYWQDFVMKKSAHVIEYGIFGTLLYRAFRGSGVERKRSMIFAVAISILYGVTDEIHQSFTPGREPKIRDVFFDALGASLAVYFVDRKGILNKS